MTEPNRGFTADADRLRAKANEYPALAQRAGAIHSGLSDALAELGPCWGGDAVGQSFAAVHQQPAQDTLAGLESLPDRLGSVGTHFADTAVAYHAQDDAGARRISAAGE